MPRLRSFVLRATLGLSLALGAGGLVTSGCTPPKPDQPKQTKKQKKAPKKSLPKNPWLDGVLEQAEVTVTSADGKKQVTCKWNDAKKRHLCPDQEPWVYVGPQALKVDGKDAYCVWQHPAKDAVVTTKLKGLAKEPLELRHAFTGLSAGVKEAAPVDIVLRVDGEERVKTQRVRKAGFDTVRVEPAAEGKPGDLEIRVSASHTGVAHFCWQLGKAAAAKPAVAAVPVSPATGDKPAPTPEVKAASAAAPADKAAEPAKAEAATAEAQPKKLEATTKGAVRKKPAVLRSNRIPKEGLKPRLPVKLKRELKTDG